MASGIVFPGESKQVADAVYGQIVKLRVISTDQVIRNLKGFLKLDRSVQIAVVLINDDPTQMRLVSHLPTLVFEELRAAKLVAARMEDKLREVSKASNYNTISREEFNELSSLVKEIPELIAQSKLAIQEDLELVNKSNKQGARQSLQEVEVLNKSVKSIEMQTVSIQEAVAAIARLIGDLGQKVRRIMNYLWGFGSATGYQDPQAQLEEGVARAMRR